MSINESDILNWIEACKQQDRVAQEKLYKHFYPLLMPVCMSYVSKNDDAVDIYNQAFLKGLQFAQTVCWTKAPLVGGFDA